MENTYPDGENYICADCGHEWPMQAAAADDDADAVIKDANGNVLADGDAPLGGAGRLGRQDNFPAGCRSR